MCVSTAEVDHFSTSNQYQLKIEYMEIQIDGTDKFGLQS